jgi:hypothetical protein
LARGRTGAQFYSLDYLVGIRAQRGRFRILFLHRRAISPRTHAANETAVVRLSGPVDHGGFTGRRGGDAKLPHWSGGKRLLAVFPVIYTSIMFILHHRVGGPATAAVLASAIPGLAGFGVALLTLHLTVLPLGSATALAFALAVSVAWNAAVYVTRPSRGMSAKCQK